MDDAGVARRGRRRGRGRALAAALVAAVVGAAGVAGASGGGDAGAAPAPAPGGVPAGWVALPGVAAAARHAMPGDARAAAWGDPAAGCYLVAVAVPGKPGEGADAARGELTRALGLGPAAGGRADGPIREAGLTGSARAWVVAAGARVVSSAAACVYNDREPATCAAACAAIWSHLSSPPELS